MPRICFVKQSTQSDLYCIGPGASASEIVASTLMRSGPVALFSALNADFIIVEPEIDLETTIWRQPADELGWVDVAELENLRECTPFGGVGQSAFATRASEVDWSMYDIVISLDISVPYRITRQHPDTVWCYYIREPKTSAYSASLNFPLAGYDLFLNQEFSLLRKKNKKSHEICFPYYLQYPGCFDDLYPDHFRSNKSFPTHEIKDGLFLEQHSAVSLATEDLELIRNYWPIYSTAPIVDGAFRDSRSHLSLLQKLTLLRRSYFFLRISRGRNIWGNALVEAISAGCVVIGDPSKIIHSEYLLTKVRHNTIKSAVKAMNDLLHHEKRYLDLLDYQSHLIEYACWRRPILDLFSAVSRIKASR